VDKTEVIHRLITSGKPFFLARPRRFGKSLLVSTLAEIFKGNKPLFEGLAIYDKWDWSRKHPVIHLDWSGTSFSTIDEMELRYREFLLRTAKDYGVEISSKIPELRALVEALFQKYNQQVVVLVDEYDKPMQDAIDKDNPQKLADVRVALNRIYNPLKSCDPYLKFLLLTGISRFAGLSVFSTLNNLTDISLDKRYSTICGYTQEELESNFSEYIDALAQNKNTPKTKILADIRAWYNGYSWDGKTSVYNPYSTLRLLNVNEFENFWFLTATPTFLIDIISERKRENAILGEIVVDTLSAMTDDPYKVSESILLFQTGYLTIKKIQELPTWERIYTLDFPNREVRESFVRSLLAKYKQSIDDNSASTRRKLEAQLLAADSVALSETLREVLAWIPYEIIVEDEHYYHSILLLWLRLLGFNITAELSTNLGRIDAVWELPDQIFVAEIKYGRPAKSKKSDKSKKSAKGANAKTTRSENALNKLLAAAFAQIEEKRYPERYKTENKKIKALAIACSGKEIKCEVKKIEGIREV
jgi:hypothetical protein